MRKLIYIITLLFILSSCEKVLMETEPANDPATNFEYLWSTADEKYSFFDYKGINWDEVYNEYKPQINDGLTDVELFDILAEMLNKLQDGHVNIIAPFDISRYNIDYSSPENYNFRLLEDNYIGWDYRITGPLINTSFERNGIKIGYICIKSFSYLIQEADIDYALNSLEDTRGLILDLRGNGGGYIYNVFLLGPRFADTERLIGTSIQKDGPDHEDFTEAIDINMEPDGEFQWTKPVILLTNRGSFSATSFFALAMKAFPHVVQVGDTTGGGLGVPAGFELPNGWGYRFSVTQTFSANGDNWESGVPPDHTVWMDPVHELEGIDDIMEKAIEIIINN